MTYDASAIRELEGAILPTAAAMLDSLLDAAQGARPGIDAARYAEQLRRLAEGSQRATAEILSLYGGARLTDRERASAA